MTTPDPRPLWLAQVEDDVGVAEAEKNRERLLRIMEAADPS